MSEGEQTKDKYNLADDNMKDFTREDSARETTHKIMNIRPTCMWAVFVMLTIAICFLASSEGIHIIVIWFVFLFVFFGVLSKIRVRGAVLRFLGGSRLFFVVNIALCIIVATVFFAVEASYNRTPEQRGQNTLSGVIMAHGVSVNGSVWLRIGDAEFGDEKLDGRVMVFIDESLISEFSAQTTYRVSVEAVIEAAYANTRDINNKVRYSGSARAEPILCEPDSSVRSEIIRYAHTYFDNFLSRENADLIHAMLFGDSAVLDDTFIASFKMTGSMHVLAVSGLHVMLIAQIFMGLLKVLRVKRGAHFPIVLSVLLCYCYLCDFRYSILRATIMFSVLMINKIYLRRTDLLSSLGLAMIIVLLIFPHSLMSASFELSFACMFGIALLSRPINALVRSPFTRFDFKIVESTCEAVSMYFSAFVGSLPFIVMYFGYVTLVGVFANVLVLPFLVLSFQMAVIALLTYVAFPLFWICTCFLEVSKAIMHALASLPFASVQISGGGALQIVMYYMALVMLSRFIFLPKRVKNLIGFSLLGLYFVSWL